MKYLLEGGIHGFELVLAHYINLTDSDDDSDSDSDSDYNTIYKSDAG